MKKLIAIGLMLISPALKAACVRQGTGLTLEICTVGTSGDVWGAATFRNFGILNSSVPVANSSNTFTSAQYFSTITASGFVHLTTGSYISLPAISTGTQTSFSACIASTVTITTHGEDVDVFFYKVSSHTTGGSYVFFWTLRDGAFVTGSKTGSTGATFAYDHASNNSIDANTYNFRDNPASGQHNYCIGFGSDNNTAVLNNRSVFGVRTKP